MLCFTEIIIPSVNVIVKHIHPPRAKKGCCQSSTPHFSATAAVIAPAATAVSAAAAIGGAQAAPAAAAEEQNQDDEPPASAKTVISTHSQEPPVFDEELSCKAHFILCRAGALVHPSGKKQEASISGWNACGAPSRASQGRRAADRESAFRQRPDWSPPAPCACRTGGWSEQSADPPRGRCCWDP